MKIRLIAGYDGEAVGIGAIAVANSELRGCYVTWHAARRSVWSAIMSEIERIARAPASPRH
jgi:hypothetical protein